MPPLVEAFVWGLVAGAIATAIGVAADVNGTGLLFMGALAGALAGALTHNARRK